MTIASKGTILREIAEGPDAIRVTIEESRDAAHAAAALMRSAGVRRVFLIGNGTSLFSCEFVAGWYRVLAGPMDPLLIPISAGEFLHHRPRIRASDAVLGISSSGEFRDVVGAIREVRGSVPVVGVVQVATSTVATLADALVVAGGGAGETPVMTKTFLSTATAAAMVALGLLADHDAADAGRAQLWIAADHAEQAIGEAEPLVGPLAERLREFQHAFVVGTGGAAVAAREGALKLKEMAILHAEGVETWEAESGSATIIGPGSFLVGIRPGAPSEAATERLSRLSGEWGATVVEVAQESRVPGATLLPIPSGALDVLAALYAVPPIALLGYHLAVARGLNPDEPTWATRYASQGLSHIVGGSGGE